MVIIYVFGGYNQAKSTRCGTPVPQSLPV